MKKLLGFAILIMAIFAVADSTKNTPMNVATRAMQCIVNNDFDGYACLHHLDINANGADGDKTQTRLIHPIATTLQRLYDKATSNGGLKSFPMLVSRPPRFRKESWDVRQTAALRQTHLVRTERTSHCSYFCRLESNLYPSQKSSCESS